MASEESCIHDAFIWKGMCSNCGAFVGEGDGELVPIVGNGVDKIGLTARRDNASALHAAETKKLMEQRQLVLILDLDKTLIHTTVDDIASHWIREGVHDIFHFELGGRVYFTKTRPGLHAFLEQVKTSYELHVYTMGTRPYAMEILKIIDPDRSYFANRIITQNESFKHNSKSTNLEALLPNGDRMAVVVDDLPVVWDHRPNLIPAVPYEYFNSVDEVNAIPQQPNDRKQKQSQRAKAHRRLAISSHLQVNDALVSIFQDHFALPATYPGTTTTQSRVSVSSGDDTPSLASAQTETQVVQHDSPNSAPADAESHERAANFARAVAYACVLRMRRTYDWGLEERFRLASAAEDIAQCLGLTSTGKEVLETWCDEQQQDLDSKLHALNERLDSKRGKLTDASRISTAQVQAEAKMAVASIATALAGHTTLFVDQPMDLTDPYRAHGDTTIMMQCSPQLQERRFTATDHVESTLNPAHTEIQRRWQDDIELREPSALFQAAQRFVLSECCCLRHLKATEVGFQADLGSWVREQTQASDLKELVQLIHSRALCLELLEACLLVELGRQRGDHSLWKGLTNEEVLLNLLASKKGIQRRLVLRPPVENDTTLTTIGSALMDLHVRFFEAVNHAPPGSLADTREILPGVRLDFPAYPPWLLANCTIVFTGVIPSGSDAKRHHLYQKALCLGATIANEVTEMTTHVVAVKPGTAKLQKALRTPGTFIVHVDWLEACYSSSIRKAEGDFRLNGLPSVVPMSAAQDSKRKPSSRSKAASDHVDMPSGEGEPDLMAVFDNIEAELDDDLGESDDDEDETELEEELAEIEQQGACKRSSVSPWSDDGAPSAKRAAFEEEVDDSDSQRSQRGSVDSQDDGSSDDSFARGLMDDLA
eukprot:m.155451 g.155451  ORF g.155451 m.155451 type:complete len:882 (+) comp16416_c0_seq3:87-2732(+)